LFFAFFIKNLWVAKRRTLRTPIPRTTPKKKEGHPFLGVSFLLFLLGLNLYPQKLIKLLKETIGITLASTVVFGLLGYVVAASFGFTRVDCLLVGMARVDAQAHVQLYRGIEIGVRGFFDQFDGFFGGI
jgi:hypothetical protein